MLISSKSFKLVDKTQKNLSTTASHSVSFDTFLLDEASRMTPTDLTVVYFLNVTYIAPQLIASDDFVEKNLDYL